MLAIKGLGPKKIATIWKDLEVESLGELLYACQENRLLLYKGFGSKSQENIRQSLEFYFSSQGLFRYADAESAAFELQTTIKGILDPYQVMLTGAIRRQEIIIDRIDLLTDAPEDRIRNLGVEGLKLVNVAGEYLDFRFQDKFNVRIFIVNPAKFAWKWFETTGSAIFMEEFLVHSRGRTMESAQTEQDIFSAAGLAVIDPGMREGLGEIPLAASHKLPQLISTSDIRGIIHCHSNWSDGLNSLEELAEACLVNGFEYLVISDHSKSAFYANGLSPERVHAQHQLIDELNARMAPFRIFKSIESDILNDGSLDYPKEILETFDLVIASVHTNLKMSPEKTMARLLSAIENPYTTILGHLTGRLLLSRPPYPVDHDRIIEACVANGVVIELNANPSRLDIDWRHIPQVLKMGGLISINPDSHAVKGFGDIRYGVLAARKGGLTAANNLSSLHREQLGTYFLNRKKDRK